MLEMIYFTGLIWFLLLLTADAGVGNSSELSFCNETAECLLFELVCKFDDYEVRRYDSVKWVTTSFSTPSLVWWFIVVPAFWRLQNYLDDNNIPMKTAPVTIKIPAEEKPQTQHSSLSWLTSLVKSNPEYTMSFLLPAEYQDKPPRVSNPNVKIEVTPEMYVFVRSYNDWVKGDSAQAQLLFSSLNMTKYDASHYAAGYTSPFNKEPYSEVWVLADSVPPCPSKRRNSTQTKHV